jgi:hypothetical protein
VRNRFVKILLVLVALALLIPFPTTSVPEWKVKVVDEIGNPLANVEVRQTWSHGQGDVEDNRISNEQGYVVFPARKLILPLILRIPLRALEHLENLTLHGASIGGRAYIWSANADHRNWLHYYEGGEIKDTLVIRH